MPGGLIPGPPNVGGRSCNGPVVVEYVAAMLKAPLENYGVGGARTGETNMKGNRGRCSVRHWRKSEKSD